MGTIKIPESDTKEIPEILQRLCKGYQIKYCGLYQDQDVDSITFRHPPGVRVCTGLPAYLLVSRDGHETVAQVSDEDFAITRALIAQAPKPKDEPKPKPYKSIIYDDDDDD